MSEIIKKTSVSLPVRLNISTPSWAKQVGNQANHHCHFREGMSVLKIARNSSKVRFSKEQYDEAKYTLEHFQKLSSVPVSMEIFREVFKLVNAAVVNSFSQEVFNFKIKALYSIFADYPACIFTQETARKIAKLNTFFPSGKEIELVLNQAKNELDSEIENLKAIVGYGVHANEEQIELQEKRRQYLQDKVDQERQIRINRLNAITKPIDDLNQTIKEAVENYMPENYQNMDSQSLIIVFNEQINIVQDEQIKAILQEKIDALRSKQKQIEDLKKLGVVVLPIKQRAAV